MSITFKHTIYNIGYLAKKYNVALLPTVTFTFKTTHDRAHFEAHVLAELISDVSWTERPISLENLTIYGVRIRTE